MTIRSIKEHARASAPGIRHGWEIAGGRTQMRNLGVFEYMAPHLRGLAGSPFQIFFYNEDFCLYVLATINVRSLMACILPFSVGT